MCSTHTQSQLCTATTISSFIQCQVSFRLLPLSVVMFILIEFSWGNYIIVAKWTDIYVVFTTEGFFEVAIESWCEWNWTHNHWIQFRCSIPFEHVKLKCKYNITFYLKLKIVWLISSVCWCKNYILNLKNISPILKGHLQIAVIRIRKFPFQTPLVAWPVLRT